MLKLTTSRDCLILIDKSNVGESYLTWTKSLARVDCKSRFDDAYFIFFLEMISYILAIY